MANVGYIFPTHAFQIFNLCNVLEQPHYTGASIFCHNGYNADPQKFISGQCILQGAWLSCFQDTGKSIPNLAVRHQVQRSFYIYRAKHPHESRIIMGQVAHIIQSRYPICKTAQNAPELAFFTIQLMNGLGKRITHAVHGTSKNSYLTRDILVCPYIIISIGQSNSNFGHIGNGFVHLLNTGDAYRQNKRYGTKSQHPKSRI